MCPHESLPHLMCLLSTIFTTHIHLHGRPPSRRLEVQGLFMHGYNAYMVRLHLLTPLFIHIHCARLCACAHVCVRPYVRLRLRVCAFSPICSKNYVSFRCPHLLPALPFSFPFLSFTRSRSRSRSRSRLRSLIFTRSCRSNQDYAYPADELMPLSCKGRVRGKDKSRSVPNRYTHRHSVNSGHC